MWKTFGYVLCCDVLMCHLLPICVCTTCCGVFVVSSIIFECHSIQCVPHSVSVIHNSIILNVLCLEIIVDYYNSRDNNRLLNLKTEYLFLHMYHEHPNIM